MTSPIEPRKPVRTGFRLKLLVAMMIVVAAITASGLYVEQRNLAAETARHLQREFQGELASLHNTREVRHATLVERCQALARKPRLHAALEDNALDLLYPSAKDELRDVMEAANHTPESVSHGLHAEFYRFLDLKGAVISPPNPKDVGELRREEESQLALKAVPRERQLGYLVKHNGIAGETISEVIAVPIISIETDEVIAALVLGFKPAEVVGNREANGIKGGIWVNGRLHLSSLGETVQTALDNEMSRVATTPDCGEGSLSVHVDGVPHLLFYKLLNPDSFYPPAYEVCIFPLTDLLARQRQVRWQILGAGALMLLVGFVASHFFSARLSVPVEKLAVDSEENRAQRKLAEAALEHTNVELQRSVRFSADASHQLKTPVTVLRAGLEELLTQEDLAPEMREEVSELVHQTYRLTSVIEDLLLLSRMDAGRLQLDFVPVNLSQVIEAELDDVGAQPNALDLAVEPDFPAALHIAGEKRYTVLIVRNLLENARKYNRLGGRVRVAARQDGDQVLLSIGNTGRPIPPTAQKHIFERFHRASVGENIPGHGLGLNLARELARIHGGDLRLICSDDTWTEFEVRFRFVKPSSITTADPA
ncbi:MAG: HAMP domain-containing sensor histidine kinase [Verrucomicrobia bacterium]|nr:HAMP domain-containing sensor histidine kinase [Verrucomicrobiota bacterium]